MQNKEFILFGLDTPRGRARRLDSVSRLAAGIAHDFTQLFSTIQSYATLLLASPATSREATEWIRQIAVANQRAIELAQQLQSLGRRKLFESAERDLYEVALGVVAKFQSSLPSAVELLFEPPELPLPSVHCEESMIEQALSNLLNNALEAMPDGGKIRVRTEGVEVDATHVLHRPEARLGEFVSLAVSDTGAGMDTATLRRAFEPFFSTKAGRAGLGLSKAYGIAKLHRGWMEVSTQLYFGSTFTLFLPAVTRAGHVAGRPCGHSGVGARA
jgi:signal transduction histidine kinase